MMSFELSSCFYADLPVSQLLVLYLFSSPILLLLYLFFCVLNSTYFLCTHSLHKPNSHLGFPNKCHIREGLHLTYFSCCSISVSHSGPLLENLPAFGPKLRLVSVFLETSALFASLSKRRYAKLQTNCVIDSAQIRFSTELNNKDIM
jgi:hypothetical protein